MIKSKLSYIRNNFINGNRKNAAIEAIDYGDKFALDYIKYLEWLNFDSNTIVLNELKEILHFIDFYKSTYRS